MASLNLLSIEKPIEKMKDDEENKSFITSWVLETMKEHILSKIFDVNIVYEVCIYLKEQLFLITMEKKWSLQEYLRDLKNIYMIISDQDKVCQFAHDLG